MPSIPVTGPIALAIGLVTLVALTALFTHDPRRRATALVVLRLLLRRRDDPSNDDDTPADHQR